MLIPLKQSGKQVEWAEQGSTEFHLAGLHTPDLADMRPFAVRMSHQKIFKVSFCRLLDEGRVVVRRWSSMVVARVARLLIIRALRYALAFLCWSAECCVINLYRISRDASGNMAPRDREGLTMQSKPFC